MGRDLSQDAEIWDDAYKLDRAHVFHSWHAQRNLDPTEVVTGHGVWLKYGDGREMLDFTSQQVNVNIGYQHPKVIEGIKKQAELLCTVGPDYANLARGRAASLVARRAPEGFDKVFFTNAGADANENAMRAARLFTGRDKILSSYRCYHGNTGAAISATGDWRRKPNDYSRGHVHFFTPYLYRSEFSATTQEEECERALAHLEHVIQFVFEAGWPEADESKLVQDSVEIALQIGGKLRGKMQVAINVSKEEAIAQAKEALASRLEGKTVVKEIYVPGKIINLIVK